MEPNKLAGAYSSSSSSSSSSSIADELFGRKDGGNSSSSGIFGSVFAAAPSSGAARDSKSNYFGPARKQGSESQSWTAQSPTSDGNFQGSPSKGQSASRKERYAGESVSACNLSSSLYYGGQDICSTISSKQAYGTQYTIKNDEEDSPDNANMASRGNWWQGSLYY